jgi:hypothetical protein
MGLFATSVDDPQYASNMGLFRGIASGDVAGGIEAAQEGLLNRKIKQVDLSSKQLAEKRAQATFEMMQEAIKRRLAMGQGAPSQPETAPTPGGLLGSGTFGMPTGGQAASAPQGGPSGSGGNVANELQQLDLESLMNLPGVQERLATLKYRNEMQPVQAGGYTRNPVTGAMAYNPDPTKGVTMGPGGSVQMMPGADAVQAQLAGATTAAQEGAKDQFAAPITLANLPGGPRTMLPSQARAFVGGGGAAPGPAPMPALPAGMPAPAPGGMLPSRVTPQQQAALDSDRPAILQGELAKAQARVTSALQSGDAASAQRALGDVASLKKEMGGLRIAAQPAAAPAAGDGLPGLALKTSAQEAADAANADFVKKRAAGAADYETSLNGRVTQGADMNMRLQEQLKALNNFKAGGGGETRAQLAQIAQGVPGISPSIVNGIAGGNLASMQEFNKLAAQTAMEQLKQSMGGAGRISQYEFKVFQNNNPNLSTDPDAIRKIFDFNTKIFNRDLTEQKAFNAHVDAGGNPASFASQWQQRQADMGYTNPNLSAQNTSAPATPNLLTDLPKVAPKGQRVRDTQTGKVLKFDGMTWKPE